MANEVIGANLDRIFTGIAGLRAAFPNRRFTIDGRLAGDLGEIIAELAYELELDAVSRPIHDAVAAGGRDVQIKATFKKHLTLRAVPDYYLGLKLFPDGRFEEVFNGPGQMIAERYSHRRWLGKKLLSFPTSELSRISATVPESERIRHRSQRG